MTSAWKIDVQWEQPLDEGGPDERNCFAAIGIQANDVWLTEGRDALAIRLRQAPLLSAYHLAEWFAWNWWRLRWEPRASGEEWRFAHKMANIGGGYVWPNITIFSDGERTTLIAQATKDRPGVPFRYINDSVAIIPSTDFESEIDIFLGRVLDRLESMKVANTNLARVWDDVCIERKSLELAQVRKLEALLGNDPDESSADLVARLIADAGTLGIAAVEELAADHGHLQNASVLSALELTNIAKTSGFDAQPASMVSAPKSLHGNDRRNQHPAWLAGTRAAQALREQEHLDGPISDVHLAKMLAVDQKALNHQNAATVNVSFALDVLNNQSRLVLRSKQHEGRRFELARLLGDRLMSTDGGLFPATRASTYRQKAQRSFAAELLSPFSAVFNMLNGDYSQEKQADIAGHFDVSPMNIRTQLVNHKILGRDELDSEALAAA